MVRRSMWSVAGLGVMLAWNSIASAATVPFTETFASNASGWLNGASTAPSYVSSGGPDGSAYISYTSTFTSGASGPFGAPPLVTLFRGNDSANASGDAFVGDWLAAGVEAFSVAVRHNYTSTLNLYTRLDAGSGAAASLAHHASYAIAPNTWTTIVIPITNSNPPFSSYGAGTYNGVFSSIDNIQVGLYVPASTTFTDFRIDLDNVSLVPEPASLGLLLVAGAATSLGRRRSGIA